MGIKIKLLKSPSSASARQIATIKGLGLWKIGSEKLLKDTMAVRGMARKIHHLVNVSTVLEEPISRVRQKPRKIRMRDSSRLKASHSNQLERNTHTSSTFTALHALQAPRYAMHRKKRVGRGQGSGLGKTAGRGGKGQKARTGNMRFEGFEGGQSPLQRRLPKYGFINRNRLDFALVNLKDIDRHFQDGDVVDEKALRAVGLVKGPRDGIKVLGVGGLKSKITLKTHKISANAQAILAQAGGLFEKVPLIAHNPDSAAKAHSGKGASSCDVHQK